MQAFLPTGTKGVLLYSTVLTQTGYSEQLFLESHVTRTTYCQNWYFQEEKAQKQRRPHNRLHLLGRTFPRTGPSAS